MTTKPKKSKRTEKVKTLSIQRRIYPDILDKVEAESTSTGKTPTKIAATILRRGLGLVKKET